MTVRHARLDASAILIVLGCCVLWGINQSAAKATLSEVPPLLQAALRSVGAAALVGLWSAWRGISLGMRDGTAPAGLVAGTLFAAEFALIFWGLQYTHASRMIVFIYLSPFVVAVGMPWIVKGEGLRPTQWLGLGVAFGGVALAFAEGFTQASAGPMQWVGDAMGLAAAVLWGLTTLSIRAGRLSQAAPEKTLFYQLVVSAVWLGLGALLVGEAWPQRWSGQTLASLGFQTVIITFASYLVWFWLVRHYAAAPLASYTLLTPVAGLLAGVVLLGEPASPRLLAALVAVSAGLWWIQRPRPPVASSPPPSSGASP